MTTVRGGVDRTNSRRSWFEHATEEVEFLEADFVDFRYPRHVHETFAVGIIEAGAQRFATRGEETVMPPQQLCVVDPGLVHSGWADDENGWRYRMFYPSTGVVCRALGIDEDRAERQGFGRHVIDDRELFRSFRRLHRRAAAGPGLGLDEAVLAFLRALFVRHAGSPSPPTATSSRVASLVREHLHAHTIERISVGELARLAEVSETQVIRSFSRHVGMPPNAYLIALRVERAKAALAGGGRAAEVAPAVGFFDQSHLHRHFVRLVGCTPGEYAAARSTSARSATYKTTEVIEAPLDR